MTARIAVHESTKGSFEVRMNYTGHIWWLHHVTQQHVGLWTSWAQIKQQHRGVRGRFVPEGSGFWLEATNRSMCRPRLPPLFSIFTFIQNTQTGRTEKSEFIGPHYTGYAHALIQWYGLDVHILMGISCMTAWASMFLPHLLKHSPTLLLLFLCLVWLDVRH